MNVQYCGPLHTVQRASAVGCPYWGLWLRINSWMPR
jgi:hypothetical protein